MEPNKWSIQWWCRNAALPTHLLVPFGLALSVLLLPAVVAYDPTPPDEEGPLPFDQPIPLDLGGPPSGQDLRDTWERSTDDALPIPLAPSAPVPPGLPVDLSRETGPAPTPAPTPLPVDVSAESGPIEAPADASAEEQKTGSSTKTVRWWRDVHEQGAARSWTRSYPMQAADAAPGEQGVPDRVDIVTAAGFTLLLAGIGLRLAPLVAGSRLERHEVRDHPVRRCMLDHLEVHPGATTAALAEQAGIGCGRAIYHLSILEREQVVRGRRVDGRRRYFPVGAPRVDDAELAVRDLTRPERQTGRIVQILRRSPGTSLSEIARLLGMSPGQAHYHVAKLDEVGVVYRVRRGRRVRHYLTEVGQSLSARAQNVLPVEGAGGAVTA